MFLVTDWFTAIKLQNICEITNFYKLYLIPNSRYWGKLRYSAGVGASYLHYRQQEHTYDYWTFCPKAALSYDFTNALQVSYNFQSNERTSRIAMISDAMIRTNSMEWTVGSPDLKPNRETYHTLRLSYSEARLQAYIGIFSKCP